MSDFLTFNFKDFDKQKQELKDAERKLDDLREVQPELEETVKREAPQLIQSSTQEKLATEQFREVQSVFTEVTDTLYLDPTSKKKLTPDEKFQNRVAQGNIVEVEDDTIKIKLGTSLNASSRQKLEEKIAQEISKYILESNSTV